ELLPLPGNRAAPDPRGARQDAGPDARAVRGSRQGAGHLPRELQRVILPRGFRAFPASRSAPLLDFDAGERVPDANARPADPSRPNGSVGASGMISLTDRDVRASHG